MGIGSGAAGAVGEVPGEGPVREWDWARDAGVVAWGCECGFVLL